ncbi:hypothetical protein PsYK624_063060 [Phanerochaete sordida]|uniref:Uncharacterized protein n=1 Tax=Phanerochaete sordida TaxID=48140 RepID=A0A9P3GA32_9APHY|nr:hypothetical protein PsYK624_063060 [Phanerochaete sordida]
MPSLLALNSLARLQNSYSDPVPLRVALYHRRSSNESAGLYERGPLARRRHDVRRKTPAGHGRTHGHSRSPRAVPSEAQISPQATS